ncbi:Pick C1-like protein 1 [Seminavis robusta]|uniref:Pick C1-like protein 1 n=1 Tax=Seminavis robusta TaxID=568900 RepID=A0A9N8DGF7_9STRA|nr:Pick C1-like protein 1 [Seminavis robusta]|eukprot:Sro78_g042560.1 Pick C1-like protein 1 (1206) ;mRNA; r:95864-99941
MVVESRDDEDELLQGRTEARAVAALGIETSDSAFLASTEEAENEPWDRGEMLPQERQAEGTSMVSSNSSDRCIDEDRDCHEDTASASQEDISVDTQSEIAFQQWNTFSFQAEDDDGDAQEEPAIISANSSSLTALGIETSASMFLASTAIDQSLSTGKVACEEEEQQQSAFSVDDNSIQPLPESTLEAYDDASTQAVETPNIVNADSFKSQTYAGVFPWWTRCTNAVHRAIIIFVLSLAQYAARRPWKVVIGVSIFSVLVMAIGLVTNFVVVYDPEEFLIPFGTPIEEQYNWISKTFSDTDNVHIGMLIHNNGGNVITVDTTRKVLEVMDAVFTTQGYNEVCLQGDYVSIYGQTTCWSYSVARFWDFDSSNYDATIHSDEDVMDVISKATFPYGGTPVAHDILLGNYERDPDTKVITYAQSYAITVELPYKPGVEDLEYDLIQTLNALREQWSRLPEDPVQLEFLAQLSLEMEVERAVREDLPLFPFVFLIMSNLVSLVFFKRDKVKSRWLLGYGAVVTIVFSILTGFGIMFIAGVPVSSMLLVLPFIIFGIAIDDTFIITGAYFRTENITSDVYERITITMREVGLSISLTTITTICAFVLSSLSTIRAVRWLGWYATITIFIDFLYQITFYVALLVLDEKRIQANRRDVCFWRAVPREDNCNSSYDLPTPEATESIIKLDSDDGSDESDNVTSSLQFLEAIDSKRFQRHFQRHFQRQGIQKTNEDDSDDGSDDCDNDASSLQFLEAIDSKRFQRHFQRQVILKTIEDDPKVGTCKMIEESQPFEPDDTCNPSPGANGDNILLLPRRWFQLAVSVSFLGYFFLCCHSTSLLRQEFKTQDFVPDDSYVAAFVDSFAAYFTVDYVTGVYFRGVNQSDPRVQDQMRAYIGDLGELSHVGGNPPFCWVTDFPAFQNLYRTKLENMTFTEQVDFALSIPALNEVYGPDIIIDNSTGEVLASRCWLYIRQIDMNDVENQLEFYKTQNTGSLAQPINVNRKGISFFSFDYIYFVWEFYAAIERELINSIISGTIAVGVISVLLIPHWSAPMFVVPLIIMLYVDVMGTIQLMGLSIESMTFVSIIVSVGLLVDFLMHILLRYYESPAATRLEKVQQTLTTMGASILVGGLSTLLGVLPLSLGSSMVVRTVFLCFFAIVLIGLSHGLVFLPVVLSLVGPVNRGVSTRSRSIEKYCQLVDRIDEKTNPALVAVC